MTIFIVSMEGTIVSTAMPKIVSDLGSLEMMSWVFSIYLLATVVSTPVFGKLIDLYGRKRIFVIGLVLFVAASAASGAAQSMLQLILFRAFQGFGAGALFPAAMTIVGAVFQEQERAKLQAGFSAVGAIAGLTAPFLGGVIVDYFTWQWIFLVNVPIGFLCYVLLQTSYNEKVKRSAVSIDIAGGVLFIIASGSLLLSLSLKSFPLLCASIAAFGAFIWVERRSKDALVPPSLFTSRVMSFCYTAAFLLSTLYIGLNVYVPFWMQGVVGTNATMAGLALAPMSVMWTAGSYWCSVLLAKKGRKMVMLLGMVFITAAVSVLAGYGDTITHWGMLLVAAAVGLGMGLTATTFIVTIQSEANPAQLGAATSALTFLNYLAQSIGISLFGLIFNHHAVQGMSSLREQGIDVTDVNELLQVLEAKDVSASVLAATQHVMSSSISPIFLYILGFVIAAGVLLLAFPSGGRISAKEQGGGAE
ncbi:MFS transporter [Paenibacillus xanthanilyticus]|uniref:MFS transporter n=1 Tax=Paenibacillus xanthanilyticus TaxID=1783531 RepID=A0ABV8K6T1_9BACL